MSKPIISTAKRVGNLLFLSGMTGDGVDTGAQTRDIFKKIKKSLEDSGSRMENVVAATVYLTDIKDRSKYFNPIWSEYFPETPPTRTCVEAGLEPPMKVEVTVIATIK